MARTVAPETPVVYAMVPAAERAARARASTGVALEVPAYAELAQWKQLRYDGMRVGCRAGQGVAASPTPPRPPPRSG